MSPRSSTVGPGRAPRAATTDVTERPSCTCSGQVGERAEHGVAGLRQGEAQLRASVQGAAQRDRARLHGPRLRAQPGQHSVVAGHRPIVHHLRVPCGSTSACGLDHSPRGPTVEGMAVQSVEAPADVRDTALPGYAVAAIREEGRWRCARMAVGGPRRPRRRHHRAAVAALHRRGARPARRRRRVLRAPAAHPGRGGADGVRRRRRPRLRRRRRCPRSPARRAARRRRRRRRARRGPRAIWRSSPTSACPPTSWRCWRPSWSFTPTSSSRRSGGAAGSRDALAEVVDER